jgi:hypothetical protein
MLHTKNILTNLITSLTINTLLMSAPGQALVFNFSWTGNPTLDTNITTSTDSTLSATGTIEINKNAGETFALTDIVSTNINVTGNSITPFTFTSWGTAGGSIAVDGLSATFSAVGDPFSYESHFFGCLSSQCADSVIGVADQEVAYKSQSSALGSLKMTLQPVSVPEPGAFLGLLFMVAVLPFVKKGKLN